MDFLCNRRQCTRIGLFSKIVREIIGGSAIRYFTACNSANSQGLNGELLVLPRLHRLGRRSVLVVVWIQYRQQSVSLRPVTSFLLGVVQSLLLPFPFPFLSFLPSPLLSPPPSLPSSLHFPSFPCPTANPKMQLRGLKGSSVSSHSRSG